MKTAKVENVIVPFPARTVAFTMPLHKLDSFEGIKAISKLMRDWQKMDRKTRTWNKLATKAGISQHTVSNLASHTTKAPRLHTLLAIMSALGFTAVRFE